MAYTTEELVRALDYLRGLEVADADCEAHAIAVGVLSWRLRRSEAEEHQANGSLKSRPQQAMPTPEDTAPAIRTVIETVGEFAHGGDIEGTVAQWQELRFTADEVRAWLDARCFEAWAAKDLFNAGVTPEQAARRINLPCYSGEGETIGYACSNGDLPFLRACEIVRGED